MRSKNKTLATALLALVSGQTFADVAQTNGGIQIYTDPKSAYWFNLSGIIKTDATFFIGDFGNKRDEFPNGAIVRAAETTINGGVGDDISYTLSLSFDSGVSVNDAYFTYLGFKDTEISVGQVISPFCLENANSGKHVPFLERSLPVVALRPCQGVGVNIKMWDENSYFSFASTTPLHGSNLDRTGIKHRSDRLTNTARFVYAPWIDESEHKVTQVGLSAVYANNSPTFRDGSLNTDGRRFSTRPEAKGRNTPVIVNSGNSMGIDDYYEFGLEAAQQWGPLLVQAEYLHALINRDFDPNVQFYGYHAQVAYVLTGEARDHKMKNASFGGVKPTCKYGALEVAARYSMVDLNDKDIHGGRENNFALSLGWYVNEHVKILTNWIYASIDPTQELGAANNPNQGKRHLNILGVRSQVAW